MLSNASLKQHRKPDKHLWCVLFLHGTVYYRCSRLPSFTLNLFKYSPQIQMTFPQSFPPSPTEFSVLFQCYLLLESMFRIMLMTPITIIAMITVMMKLAL